MTTLSPETDNSKKMADLMVGDWISPQHMAKRTKRIVHITSGLDSTTGGEYITVTFADGTKVARAASWPVWVYDEEVKF